MLVLHKGIHAAQRERGTMIQPIRGIGWFCPCFRRFGQGLVQPGARARFWFVPSIRTLKCLIE